MSLIPGVMGALREIGRSLSATLDLDSTLDLIARKTTGVMQVDSCTLYLLDPDGETLRLRASTGLGGQVVGVATLRVGEGMTGQAVARNAPVAARSAHQHPAFKLIDARREEGLQSLLAIPLVIENRPIGALNIQTATPRDFTPAEIELLSLIGDLAAGALVKAQILDQQKSRLAELQAVASVSELITSPQYLDEMLDIVTGMAAEAMGAALCTLYLLDDESAAVMLRSARPELAGYRPIPGLPVGSGIIGNVARTGERRLVPDLAADPRFVNHAAAAAAGLRSLLAVPLTVRDRIIGVLACYTADPRDFSDKQIALFATLANQTALAIENARLVTNVAIVREMHHRIKNNLQMVALLMQMQIPEAQHEETRLALAANIHRVHSIAAVHAVLSEKGFRLVDVREVLTTVARATEQAVSAPNRPIAIRVAGEALSLPSQAATAVAIVVNEMVQNAVEHAFVGQAQGEVWIEIGRNQSDHILTVRDNGIGLAHPPQPGLGLEIAHTLIDEDLRGSVTFSPAHPGTLVTLRFPGGV